MLLTYQVISQKNGESLIKFYYQENKRYGEFYLRFNRLGQDINNLKSPIGTRGVAEVKAKDQDYAFPLLQGFSEALEFVKRCEVCGKVFNPDRRNETCNLCWEEIQNDHMGNIE